MEPPVQMERKRRLLLPLILLGLLALAVVVSATLVQLRRVPARNGEDILAQLRREGLSAYWPQGRRTQWFLIHEDGQVRGWKAVIQQRKGEDAFQTLTVWGTSRKGDWEWSQLNRAATQGRYLAGSYGLEGIGFDTEIDLSEGRVRARRLDHAGSQWVEAAAPANYMPEGTLELAIFLAGRQDKKALFQLIQNNYLPDKGSPTFGSMLVEGGDATTTGVEGAAVRADVKLYSSSSPGEESYVFDNDGRTLRLTRTDAIQMTASPQDVDAAFGDATRIVEFLRRHLIQGQIQEEQPPEEGQPVVDMEHTAT